MPRHSSREIRRTRRGTFEAGIACTLSELLRMGHACDVMIKDVLDGFGLSLDDLKKGGADEDDLQTIREAL